MADLLSLLKDNSKPIPQKHFMVLDVETRRSAKEVGGWHKACDMGVSIAVLYDSAEHNFCAYTQDELEKMFAKLRTAQCIVGFNIIGFDYKVLQPFAAYDLSTLPTLDLLLAVKNSLSYRVSLDNIAKASLDIGKNANGMQALTWWKQGRLDEITTYCKQDVDVTRQIYLYGLEHGHVFFTNKGGKKSRIPVDFT